MNGFRQHKQPLKPKKARRVLEDFTQQQILAEDAWAEFEPAAERLKNGEIEALPLAESALSKWKTAMQTAINLAKQCKLSQAQELTENMKTILANYQIVKDFACNPESTN